MHAMLTRSTLCAVVAQEDAAKTVADGGESKDQMQLPPKKVAKK